MPAYAEHEHALTNRFPRVMIPAGELDACSFRQLRRGHLKIHSSLPAAARARRSSGVRTVSTSALAAVLSCAPATALADLYTWTDERGTTVISNVMPANPRRVKNFEIVIKEDPKQAALKQAAEAYERATTERLLLDRIDSLEREIRAQQARERAFAAPAEPQYMAAPMGYTADTFYPSYYPSYVFPHPPGFLWGYPPATTVVVGSGLGVPHRGFRNFRSFPAGRIVSHPVSVPVSVPVGHPVTVSVRR
jgi:hypothetical protein